MPHHSDDTRIFIFGQMIRDRLMVDIGEETIQKTGTCIIGISGLVRLGMMNMMGNDIDLFRDDVDGQIPGNEPPELVAERIGAMRTIPVVPDRAMRTHGYHAVNKGDPQQIEIEIVKETDKQTGDQQQHLDPAKKRQPILSGPEYVQPEQELFYQLTSRGNDEFPVRLLPSIGRGQQYIVHQILFSYI